MKDYTKALFIGWFIIFSVNALCSAILIALMNADWINMTGQGKFMVVVAMMLNWTNTIGAFLFSVLKKRDPKEFGDLPSTVASQTVTETKTVSVATTPEQPVQTKT